MGFQTLRGVIERCATQRVLRRGGSVKLMVVWIVQGESMEMLVFDAQWNSHVESQAQIRLA
ncbi:hypothetical protein B0T40_05995 [Chromobacterium haemolyticum]|nr:hypothetical protein B0T40_05995 [Chromobacterium haemolyticum]